MLDGDKYSGHEGGVGEANTEQSEVDQECHERKE